MNMISASYDDQEKMVPKLLSKRIESNNDSIPSQVPCETRKKSDKFSWFHKANNALGKLALRTSGFSLMGGIH